MAPSVGSRAALSTEKVALRSVGEVRSTSSAMTTLHRKAYIGSGMSAVRDGSIASLWPRAAHFRFAPNSGPPQRPSACLNRARKPTSLERPETNTLAVGAHPRDGESVEAKGMPKVK